MDNNQVSMNNNDMTLSIFEIASASIHTESKKDCAFETRGEFVFWSTLVVPEGHDKIYTAMASRACLYACGYTYASQYCLRTSTAQSASPRESSTA